MQAVSVGELKSRFSQILERVTKGEEVIISFGKSRKKVAVLLPYASYRRKGQRKLGLLKGRGECMIHRDFKMSDEEMITS